MTGPSRHLSWADLACRDRIRTPYPLDYRSDPTRLPALVAAYEALCASVGLPLVVVDGYRTVEHNKSTTGSPRSQHVQGRALDLQPPEGWEPVQLAAVALDIPAFTGIGFYPSRGLVHVDVRPAPRVAWRDVGDGRLAVMA